MFDIGFWEVTLIGVIALLVIGPERLPGAARTVGLYVGRIRRYVAHVRSDIEREIHADELRKAMHDPRSQLGELHDVVEETRSALGDVKTTLEDAQRSAADESWSEGLESPRAGSAPGSEAPALEAQPGSPDADAASADPADSGPADAGSREGDAQRAAEPGAPGDGTERGGEDDERRSRQA